MKWLAKIVPAVAIIALAAACGGGTTEEEGGGVAGPTISDISQLPRATSPMASASGSVSRASLSKAATTGINLLSATEDDFDQTDSMAACEVLNVVKDSIVSAAQADMIMCFVQNMNEQFGIVTDSGGNVIDVYDGEWHIFNLNLAGAEEGSPDKVKMQIVKNAAGSITSFEMFMCNRTGGELTQSEYTGQTVNGTAFTMTAKGLYAGAQWSGSHQVGVIGTLNSSGLFTLKTIEMKNTGGSTGGDFSTTNWQEATLTQTPGGFTIEGYQKGTYSEGGNTGTYQQAAYGAGEMLGDTSAVIANLAMGDGAVNVDAFYMWSSQEGGSDEYGPAAKVFAWLGNDLTAVVPASGSSFYPAAAGGTIPTVYDSFDFAFSADQTWVDCSDDVATAVTLPEVQEADLQTACAQYGAMNHNWINCYEAIGQHEQGEEGGGGEGGEDACTMDNVCGQFPAGGALTACQNCFPSGAKDSSTYGCMVDICNLAPEGAERTGCLEGVSVCQ